MKIKIKTRENGEVVEKWVEVEDTEAQATEPSEEELKAMERAQVMGEISNLKEELSASDYKVAKIAECTALGLPMPYDVEALHNERQALRDRINELEGGAI